MYYETNTMTPTVTQTLDINSVRMFLVLHGFIFRDSYTVYSTFNICSLNIYILKYFFFFCSWQIFVFRETYGNMVLSARVLP